MRSTSIAVFGAAAVAGLLVSCSSGPEGPEPGTPGFYWQAARDTFSAGDFGKAQADLDQLTKSGEFATRAMPWDLMLLAGTARGYADLANGFESGQRANRKDPTSFHKQMSDYRTMAAQQSLAFADLFARFQQSDKDAKIPLAFPFPGGSPAPDPRMDRILKGMPLPSAEMDDFQRRALQRAVLLATSAAVGDPGNAPKAEELFKSPAPEVPRGVFELAMASSLFDQSDVFDERKLAETDKQKALCERALKALDGVPETKESKELATKIKAAIKKIRT